MSLYLKEIKESKMLKHFVVVYRLKKKKKLRWRRAKSGESWARHGSGVLKHVHRLVLVSAGTYGDRERVFLGIRREGNSSSSIPVRKCIYNHRQREHYFYVSANTLQVRKAQDLFSKLIIIFGYLMFVLGCCYACKSYRSSREFSLNLNCVTRCQTSWITIYYYFLACE